jgi:hypothetical protein
MKGFIPRTMLGLSLSLVSLAGCTCYREIVDPCWPQRYNALERQSVNDALNAQANNGHILDQTIWNYHFEHLATGAPTAQLNPAGIEHLKLISRRRPAPDTHIFLATAQDIPGLAQQAPDKALAERKALDDRRIEAIRRYLAIQAGTAIAYNIEIHDPDEVGMAALQMVGSLPPGQPRQVFGGYQQLQSNFRGVLPAVPGSGGGGSSGSSSSGSGGSSSGGGGSSGGGSSGGAPR